MIGDWFQLCMIWLSSWVVYPLSVMMSSHLTYEGLSNLITLAIQVVILTTAIIKFKQIKKNKDG